MDQLRGQLVFLGTGTSAGVPLIGCPCAVCTSTDPRNNRLRCSVVLGLPEGALLIDTPPDLRTQLLRERIGLVHAVAYTHEHADHIMGLDDLRLFPFVLGGPVPLYCEEVVEQRIRRTFDYVFDPAPKSTHSGARPQVTLHRIGTEPFALLGALITPVRLLHGNFDVLGFRVGNVAYCTDVSAIPDESWSRLEGLDVLVLGALRWRAHPTHFNLDQAVEAARRIGARRTYFTHMGHDLDHAATNAKLPSDIQLAHDGLRVPLT